VTQILVPSGNVESRQRWERNLPENTAARPNDERAPYMTKNIASLETPLCQGSGLGLSRAENIASSKPFIFDFFEARDPEPGVRVRLSHASGEDEWTEYPESRGVINSYTDSRSD